MPQALVGRITLILVELSGHLAKHQSMTGWFYRSPDAPSLAPNPEEVARQMRVDTCGDAAKAMTDHHYAYRQNPEDQYPARALRCGYAFAGQNTCFVIAWHTYIWYREMAALFHLFQCARNGLERRFNIATIGVFIANSIFITAIVGHLHARH